MPEMLDYSRTDAPWRGTPTWATLPDVWIVSGIIVFRTDSQTNSSVAGKNEEATDE